jgi:hypothetical protein
MSAERNPLVGHGAATVIAHGRDLVSQLLKGGQIEKKSLWPGFLARASL